MYFKYYPRITSSPRLFQKLPNITFVIYPYPVGNSIELRDRYFISFSSWLATSLYTKILILMERNVFDPYEILLPRLEKMFGPRFIFSPELESDDRHVPYIDDWFFKGLDYSNSSLICWINADIITPDDWFTRILYLYNYFTDQNSQFAVISRRCDFDVDMEKIHNYTENYIVADFDELSANRTLFTDWGVDFYLINREPMEVNFDDIPNFHMGRPRWDPWVTGWLNQHINVVSLGSDYCTYHLNHKPSMKDPKETKVRENNEEGTRHGSISHANSYAEFQVKKNFLYHKESKVGKLPSNIKLNAPSVLSK